MGVTIGSPTVLVSGWGLWPRAGWVYGKEPPATRLQRILNVKKEVDFVFFMAGD